MAKLPMVDVVFGYDRDGRIAYSEKAAIQLDNAMDLRTEGEEIAKEIIEECLPDTEEQRKGLAFINLSQPGIDRTCYFCAGPYYIVSRADVEGTSADKNFLNDVKKEITDKVRQGLIGNNLNEAIVVCPWGFDLSTPAKFKSFYRQRRTIQLALVAGDSIVMTQTGEILLARPKSKTSRKPAGTVPVGAGT